MKLIARHLSDFNRAYLSTRRDRRLFVNAATGAFLTWALVGLVAFCLAWGMTP